MRAMTRFGGLAAAALVLTSFPAMAADASKGEQLARRWCSECHLVGADRNKTTEAPPFETIARNPAFNVDKLAFFLLDPHPKMPSMSLTRAEAQDLAAYIATMRR